MIHPRDQWFRIYVHNPGKAGAVLVDGKLEARWIEPPSYELESDTEHVHHPDAYHPDPHVRIAHHQKLHRRGFAEAACGHVHDPRVAFVETEGKPQKPCAECAKVTEAAKGEHAKALEAMQTKAAEEKAKRTPAVSSVIAPPDLPILEPVIAAPEPDKVKP